MPEVGRFASPDTLVPNPTDPQAFNRYSYVNNNPINYTDPSGHCFLPIPGDELICVAIALLVSDLVVNGDAVWPSQTADYPSAIGTDSTAGNGRRSCDVLPLAACYYADGPLTRVDLRDFSDNGPEGTPIPGEEFEAFADYVAEDLYTHDLDWPGFFGGRHTYDTPFYNGGSSESRSGFASSQEGVFPASQLVCIEGLGCYGRSEINYIAQGMWGAKTGERRPVSTAIVYAWKGWEYGEIPSDGSLFWLLYGYDYYLGWVAEHGTMQTQ